MATRDLLPTIGIPSCVREFRETPFHVVGAKYIRAVAEAAGGLPLLIPALGPTIDPSELIARFDGLLITGSPLNVEPHHYDGEPSVEGTLHDADRFNDAAARAPPWPALPILAICRGIQELNVAMGRTLHQRVHELPGRLNHRSPPGTMEEKYAHQAHTVTLTAGGFFERLAGAREITVNSLHSQGIDRLAPGLVIEAVAPDGQIEAVRVSGASFAIGVQWHPEFRVLQNAVSTALFAAFGDACRARAAGGRAPEARQRPPRDPRQQGHQIVLSSALRPLAMSRSGRGAAFQQRQSDGALLAELGACERTSAPYAAPARSARACRSRRRSSSDRCPARREFRFG
jgi:putative glutamine amidotransferase